MRRLFAQKKFFENIISLQNKILYIVTPFFTNKFHSKTGNVLFITWKSWANFVQAPMNLMYYICVLWSNQHTPSMYIKLSMSGNLHNFLWSYSDILMSQQYYSIKLTFANILELDNIHVTEFHMQHSGVNLLQRRFCLKSILVLSRHNLHVYQPQKFNYS